MSLFTLRAVRLTAVPAAVFVAACLDRGYQTDYWQHLARGRLVAREQAVVSVDRFTFTVPGEPLQDNNWLTQLLYHALHSAGGLDLVQVVNAAVLAATLALLVRMCWKASGSTGVAAVVAAVAFLGLWQTFLIRPQTFSMLLFVLLYMLLERAREHPRVLVVVPLLMAVWANVHGGFAVGLALVAAFLLGALVAVLCRGVGGKTGGEGRAPTGGAGEEVLTLTLSPGTEHPTLFPSRGAAEEGSPRRQTWVSDRHQTSPGRGVRTVASYAPAGASSCAFIIPTAALR